jgi:hypothetical protein
VHNYLAGNGTLPSQNGTFTMPALKNSGITSTQDEDALQPAGGWCGSAGSASRTWPAPGDCGASAPPWRLGTLASSVRVYGCHGRSAGVPAGATPA